MKAGTVPMMNRVMVSKFAPWNGNWYQWRAAMEAAADLQGVGEAVQAGMDLAANPETKPNNRALEQSKRLCSMLLLALCTREEGTQSSIVQEAFYNGRDGIGAVAQLVKHFELTDVGCKADELVAEFHATYLQPNGDPDAVYYKLQDLRRQLCTLGEHLNETDVTRRLVVTLGEEYLMEVALYRTSGMSGERMSLQQFRTLIQHAYKRRTKNQTREKTDHNGFVAIATCDHFRSRDTKPGSAGLNTRTKGRRPRNSGDPRRKNTRTQRSYVMNAAREAILNETARTQAKRKKQKSLLT